MYQKYKIMFQIRTKKRITWVYKTFSTYMILIVVMPFYVR